MRHRLSRAAVLLPSWFLIAVLSCAYFAIGLCLILQPERFDNTPSYGVLLEIFGQAVWGGVYLAVAAGLATSLLVSEQAYGRLVVVVSHTAAIALTGSWLAAFVVRWLTDSGTTVVNIVSWGVYLALLIRSALQLDALQPWRPAA